MVIFPLAPDQTIAQMWSNGARGGSSSKNYSPASDEFGSAFHDVCLLSVIDVNCLTDIRRLMALVGCTQPHLPTASCCPHPIDLAYPHLVMHDISISRVKHAVMLNKAKTSRPRPILISGGLGQGRGQK